MMVSFIGEGIRQKRRRRRHGVASLLRIAFCLINRILLVVVSTAYCIVAEIVVAQLHVVYRYYVEYAHEALVRI